MTRVATSRHWPTTDDRNQEGTPVTSSSKREWLVPVGLIMLSAVPVIAGAARLTELTGGATVTPDNARFFASPVPVLVHIVGASLYCLLGAVQFARGFRRRRPGWHRIAGRLLVPCGLAAALSGMWMAAFYPRPPIDDMLLTRSGSSSARPWSPASSSASPPSGVGTSLGTGRGWPVATRSVWARVPRS